MKKVPGIFSFRLLLSLLASGIASCVLFLTSCKKEYSCENCLPGKTNKPPVANAGADQKIILPKDSVFLDGTGSFDPDGNIASYHWSKISGPATSLIVQPNSITSFCKALKMGVYKFELRVTDSGGLSSKDTIQVIVNDPLQNQPPVANASVDQTIVFPIDNTPLDGSLSFDPDGTISSWQWTKISGPASFNMSNPQSVQTIVSQLSIGIYTFELKVTDNGGLSSKDTMVVTVKGPNQPPVANAGVDQTVSLPFNSLQLDGSLSSDPDGTIISWQWTKIGGPAPFTLFNPQSTQPTVTLLMQGIYFFELKVTDNEGLIDMDTVSIIVNLGQAVACGRPVMQAHLEEIGQLTIAGMSLACASAGNRIAFAGGLRQSLTGTEYNTRVDIYDITTNSWSTAELSQAARQGVAAASVGNKILFAGGGDNDNGFCTTRVDIFNTSSNTWTTAELSQAREYLSAVTVGNKVLFAGGGTWSPTFNGFNTVDIYDNATNSWSTAALSQGRWGLAGVAAGNKAYFSGGATGPGGQNSSTRIDIYDASTNSWSISYLQSPRSHHAAIASNGNIYWSGGIENSNSQPPTLSATMEIMNIATANSSNICISPRYFHTAVSKNNYLVFFTGAKPETTYANNQFEIFDLNTNTWYTGVLNQSIILSAVISVNNTIYVAGGEPDWYGPLTNKVWKLVF